MKKFAFSLLVINMLFIFQGVAVAQTADEFDHSTGTPMMAQISEVASNSGNLSDELVVALTQSNAKTDRLINLISLIATIFGAFIVVVLAFAAGRQYLIDKEMNEYKEKVKDTMKFYESEKIKFAKISKEFTRSATAKLEQLDGVLKDAKERKQGSSDEIEKIRKEIEALKQEATFAQGRLAGIGDTSSVFGGITRISAQDFQGTSILNRSFGVARQNCENCGRVLSESEKGRAATWCDNCMNTPLRFNEQSDA